MLKTKKPPKKDSAHANVCIIEQCNCVCSVFVFAKPQQRSGFIKDPPKFLLHLWYSVSGSAISHCKIFNPVISGKRLNKTQQTWKVCQEWSNDCTSFALMSFIHRIDGRNTFYVAINSTKWKDSLVYFYTTFNWVYH